MDVTGWISAGGDPERLRLYRALGPVEPIMDASGRALVFANGAIGDFTGGPTLLAAAEQRLRALGVRDAVGPLDGNTFFMYRARIGEAGPALFPGEPVASPDVWRLAGWREDARYTSTECPNAPQIARRAPLPTGWRVRPLDRFDADLRAIWDVTTAAFADAWRYQPIPFSVFAALQAPRRERIDPRWVLIAEDETREARGFLLAFPLGDRFVIKTIAVRPDARRQRLAGHLMWTIHQHAEDAGIASGIHALMWEGSFSQAITAHGGRVVRRYALYRKRL